MRLSDFRVLTFDCYGTLIDWESGIVAALKPLAARARRELTRDDILEAHARHESAQQVFTPARSYRDILATVCKRLTEEWEVAATACNSACGVLGEWKSDSISFVESCFIARNGIPFSRNAPIW